MSCPHCTMQEQKSGNVVLFVEGEPYEARPYYSASIEQSYYQGEPTYWLHCEKRGWIEGEVEYASIPIRFCPWCGDELKEVRE